MEDHIPVNENKPKNKKKLGGELKAGKQKETLSYVTLLPGDIFGEISLVAAVTRRASLQAITASDIFQLSRESLQEVLQYHPKSKKIIDERAHQRFGSRIDAPELKLDVSDFGFERSASFEIGRDEPKHTLLNPEGVDEAQLQRRLAERPTPVQTLQKPPDLSDESSEYLIK